jgi:PAS domain S-box-containing protein
MSLTEGNNEIVVDLRLLAEDPLKSKLKQIRQNYESFFNSIDDLFFVLDKSGHIIQTNNTVNERLGYKSKELVGKTIYLLYPSEQFNETSTIIAEMLSGFKKGCSIPVVSKQGILIPAETVVSLGIWDDMPVVFWVSREITSRIAKIH